MADWYCSSVAYAAVTAWSAGATITTGDIRKQISPTAGNERCFRAGNSGTTGGSEPTWVITKGATTSDNGITWTEVTGNSTYNTPTAMTAPARWIQNMCSWANAAGGDRILVASNHIQNPYNTALDTIITAPGSTTSMTLIMSFDPTQATLTYQKGAQLNIPAGGNNNRSVYYNGFGTYMGFNSFFDQTYSAGAFGSDLGRVVAYDINLNANAAGNRSHTVGQQQSNNYVTLRGVNFQIGLNSSPILIMGNVDWEGGTVTCAGSNPTSIFSVGYGYIAAATLRNLDLSPSYGSGKNIFVAETRPYVVSLSDCKLGTGVSAHTNTSGVKGLFCDLMRCSDNGNVYRNERYSNGVSQTTDTTLAVVGEATDGITPLSWKIVTPSVMNIYDPFLPFPLEQWNETVFTGITAKIQGISNTAAMPNDLDVGCNISYYGSSSSNLQTTMKIGPQTFVSPSTTLTASTKSWTQGAVTHRGNNTSYVLGQPIKLSSNPGRIFFCTTAGTSNSSEPAGYASAVDGGSVTDGGAVFRAGWRFEITSPSFTPQQRGPLRLQLLLTKPSTTMYFSPFITVT